MIFLFAFQLDWNLFWCVRDKVGIPLNLFPDRMTLNAAFFLCIFFIDPTWFLVHTYCIVHFV